MPPTVEEVVAQVELLSRAERTLVLDRLRQSLAPDMEPEIDAAWQQEIDRRLQAIDRGEIIKVTCYSSSSSTRIKGSNIVGSIANPKVCRVAKAACVCNDGCT